MDQRFMQSYSQWVLLLMDLILRHQQQMVGVQRLPLIKQYQSYLQVGLTWYLHMLPVHQQVME